MKLQELFEMAVRAGDITAMADTWAKSVQALIDRGMFKPVGKIGDLVVKKSMFTYAVLRDEELVMALHVDIVPNAGCVVDDVWVSAELRGQKMFSKFLMFLKTDLKQSKIQFGPQHSDQTYALLKAGGLSAFKKTWVNRDEERPFSPETIDDFYGLGNWKLVLE